MQGVRRHLLKRPRRGRLSYHGQVDLLERERELAELDALLLDAKAGEARLALIEGPAGIGKTQLVAELRRRGEAAGMRVLAARGCELEREFPFGVVRQLFEPVLDDGSFEGAAEAARPVFAAPDEEATPAPPASRRCTASTGSR